MLPCSCHFSDVPASGMYFMTYEWLQHVLAPAGSEYVFDGVVFTFCLKGFSQAVFVIEHTEQCKGHSL